MLSQSILDDSGLRVSRYEPVHGGDINKGYCLYTPDGKFFLKTNEAERYPAMLEKEKNALQFLYGKSSLKVPRVINSGITEGQQWLLLEWVERGSPTTLHWRKAGIGLAQLHRQQGESFGWSENNFIGSLVQLNTTTANWHEFYYGKRILPLVKQLFNASVFTQADLRMTGLLEEKLENLFPKEDSALLHGDLWSGNFMVSSIGEPVIYDPAIYYGHREMDIGMTLLFGGFEKLFYQSYEEEYPLESGWQQRLQLTQLYPLLVHSVLFGGHYIEKSRAIIQRFAG